MKERIGAKSHSKPAEEGFTRWLSCVNLLDQRKKKDLIYTNLSPYLCLDKSSHLCMTLFFYQFIGQQIKGQHIPHCWFFKSKHVNHRNSRSPFYVYSIHILFNPKFDNDTQNMLRNINNKKSLFFN